MAGAYSSEVMKNRFLGFLIWQSIPPTAIFLLTKTLFLILSSSSSSSSSSLLLTLTSFLSFHLSHLLFSSSLSSLSSPHPHRPAGPLPLAAALLRALLFPADPFSPEFRRRARVSLLFALFALSASLSGLAAAVCLAGPAGEAGDGSVWRLGFRGFVMGFVYGLHYVYTRRWVLEFPIIQRPLFFSFKMGIPVAITRALRLSGVAYVASTSLLLLLPDQLTTYGTMGKFIAEQFRFCVGCFAVFLSWELSHHLHRVFHSKRFIFAPPKGSAAAETNPSEPLLAALEESNPNSLLQYLAYLDLCMVCEKNVDIWRRAAFFEESGETYKRVIAVGLMPLEQLASKLGEALEVPADKTTLLQNQLRSPSDLRPDPNCSDLLNNFQLYTWCARIVASLTVHSHQEDRYGVAQLSGSNAAVISSLISCLLAVESFLGKNINVQSPNNLMGPTGMRWATSSMRKADVGSRRKRGGLAHSKAYAVADILRTSIYQIVSAFHDEMVASAKAGFIGKDWIIAGKPPFGTREMILQRLPLFLDFRST